MVKKYLEEKISIANGGFGQVIFEAMSEKVKLISLTVAGSQGIRGNGQYLNVTLHQDSTASGWNATDKAVFFFNQIYGTLTTSGALETESRKDYNLHGKPVNLNENGKLYCGISNNLGATVSFKVELVIDVPKT